MTPHKYKVGQLVEFDSPAILTARHNGPYEVMRILPSDDVRNRTYRIRSKAEPFERIAHEREMIAIDEPPTSDVAGHSEKAEDWVAALTLPTAARNARVHARNGSLPLDMSKRPFAAANDAADALRPRRSSVEAVREPAAGHIPPLNRG